MPFTDLQKSVLEELNKRMQTDSTQFTDLQKSVLGELTKRLQVEQPPQPVQQKPPTFGEAIGENIKPDITANLPNWGLMGTAKAGEVALKALGLPQKLMTAAIPSGKETFTEKLKRGKMPSEFLPQTKEPIGEVKRKVAGTILDIVADPIWIPFSKALKLFRAGEKLTPLLEKIVARTEVKTGKTIEEISSKLPQELPKSVDELTKAKEAFQAKTGIKIEQVTETGQPIFRSLKDTPDAIKFGVSELKTADVPALKQQVEKTSKQINEMTIPQDEAGYIAATKAKQELGFQNQLLAEALSAKEGKYFNYDINKGWTEEKSIPLFEQRTKEIQESLKSVPPKEPLYAETKTNPVQEVVDGLEKVKRLGSKQKYLYSIERGKRLQAAGEVGKKVPGQKGFWAQKKEMEGILPKVEFEPLNLKQETMDEIFYMVRTNDKLLPGEQLTAQTGLEKLFGTKAGGYLPTDSEIRLLQEVFGQEMVDGILNLRTKSAKAWNILMQSINLPRAAMATGDLSAPMRQGIFLIRRQKQFAPAFRDQFKYAFNEESYQGLMKRIESRPTYKLMREGKLSFTDLGADLLPREERIMSNLTEKAPVIGRIARGSNRSYTGFLNQLRADVFDDMLKKAVRLGVYEKRPDVIYDIAKYINTATGRGSFKALERTAPIINALFFSPRLMYSRLQLINPAFYWKLDPFVRKEALKDLMGFAGFGMTVLSLASLAGAKVGNDPRSADFGKIKIGDTRFDTFGGFQQYMVLGARLLSGEMVSSTTGKEFTLGEGYRATTKTDIAQRFIEQKLSPIASFTVALMRGKTSTGKEFDLTPEIVDRFIPMLAQDIYDLQREKSWEGIPMMIPGVFGVGSQTYGEMIPYKSKTPMGKPNIKWRQEPTLGEEIVNQAKKGLNKFTGTQFETGFTTIPEKEQVKLRSERLEKLKREIELNKAKRIVLETGKPQRVGNKYIYLDKGIVKTR